MIALKRGFAALIVTAIALVIGIVMVAMVIQPVVNSLIVTNQTGTNLSAYGTAQTVANQLPTLNIVVLLVLIAGAAIATFTMFK